MYANICQPNKILKKITIIKAIHMQKTLDKNIVVLITAIFVADDQLEPFLMSYSCLSLRESIQVPYQHFD